MSRWKPRALASLLSYAVVASVALRVTSARAVDCTPNTGQSTCFDADSLWFRATSDRFVHVDRAHIPEAGTITLAAATTYASRPVVAIAAAPDPEGREIHVIDSLWSVTLLAAAVPFENAELNFAAPLVLLQDGNGLGGITTRGNWDLRATALRDPRIGFAYGLPFVTYDVRGAVKALADLALPLGDEKNFAGEAGFVVAPALAAEMDVDWFFLGASFGARLRRTVPFAGARLGSDLGVSLGAGAHILDNSLLSAGAEATARPQLSSQRYTTAADDQVDSILIPAEWSVFVSSAPWNVEGPTFRLAGGGAIPLSHKTVEDVDGDKTDDWFAGVTSPMFRFVLSVHYAFGTDLDEE